jgi:PKD repeat protein
LAITTSVLETPDPLTYEQGDDVVTYPISLAATNFCGTVIDEDSVIVYPQPIANFGTDLDVFCSPFTVEINDLSTGNPDTWWGDFDDGTFSGSDEPGSHVFFADTVAVDYTISLVVTNECGTDSTDYTITVLPNTVTAFFNTNITEGCEPLEVEFTDFSEGGTAISYDFGDTFLSGEASPTHTFTEPGTFFVQQFITNAVINRCNSSTPLKG